MKIKWNWGTKLTIAIIIFMSFIFTLVYLSTQNQIFLVEKDYYPKGLAYQKRIESIKKGHPFRKNMKIRQDAGNLYLKISETSPDSGSVILYRPNQNKEQDMEIPFGKDSVISMRFDKKKLKKGIYILKITWYQDGEEYFIEEKTFINK